VASIILRHIEVGADKNALAGDLALGAQIGETDDVHKTLVGKKLFKL
jgi:hypothetical protein